MIYMDHAATTILLPEAAAYMQTFECKEYANPSGNYPFATTARAAISSARRQIAASLNASEKEICFTSGGSESDNWVLKGMFSGDKNAHIITSKIEHPAILNTCHALEKQGCKISYVNVNENGIVNIDHFKSLFKRNTRLVSIMYANNEIGTIQPIKELARIAKRHGAYVHTDAVQAYGHLPIDVKDEGIDFLSASAHKCNGPKGIGFLYMNKRCACENLIHGGGQEQGRRAGTENVAAIAGFGYAADYSVTHMEAHTQKLLHLRDYMIRRLETEIPNVRINGDKMRRLPNNINCTFFGVNAESLLALLALEDICVSVGSACHAGEATASHVLLALGLPEEEAEATLRITLGFENTYAEANDVIEKIKEAVFVLRKNRF